MHRPARSQSLYRLSYPAHKYDIIIIIIIILTYSLTHWQSDIPTNRPTDRPTDRLTDRPTDRPTNRPPDGLTDWPTHSLTHLLTYSLTLSLTHSLIHSLNYLLTYSMEQSPSSEANRFSVSQEFPHILWNPNIYYSIHKCPPPVPILSQINPIHTPTIHILKIRFIIILPSIPATSMWSLSLRFPQKNPVYASPRRHTCYMSHLSHYSPFDHSNNNACWWQGHQQATSSVCYTTSCKHSLVFLRMGEIIVRNMLSWLKLLINCYSCI